MVREVHREFPGGVTVQGLLILKLTEGGPAEKSGLRGPRITRVRGITQRDVSAADIITAVEDIPTKKADDFMTVLDERRPGDRIVLDVFREGKTVKVPIITVQ
jgi:S1-C subfamily serine protease